MEKLIVCSGFILTCVSFFLSVCVGTQCLWGFICGLGATGLGWILWED